MRRILKIILLWLIPEQDGVETRNFLRGGGIPERVRFPGQKAGKSRIFTIDNPTAMKKKILFWTPRILCILAILFVISFSFDVFEIEAPLGRQLIGFLIHNVPALVLAGLLVIAWKWDLVGGIVFILFPLLAAFSLTSFFTRNFGALVLCAPFLIAGLLFLWYWWLYKRGQQKPEPQDTWRE